VPQLGPQPLHLRRQPRRCGQPHLRPAQRLGVVRRGRGRLLGRHACRADLLHGPLRLLLGLRQRMAQPRHLPIPRRELGGQLGHAGVLCIERGLDVGVCGRQRSQARVLGTMGFEAAMAVISWRASKVCCDPWLHSALRPASSSKWG
jgi:hypothetical protein